MRRSHGLRVFLAAGLAALAAVADCSSPAPRAQKPQQREVVLATEADDSRAGAEAAGQVAAQMGILDDPALSAYVQQLGKRLARHAPSGRFTYKFAVVDQDVPNAFALPGGYIFVSRGLLAMTNSEDELAGVLGHEIVHVARRHAAARQSMMRGVPAILQNQAMGQVAAYGRNQEREADRLGQGLAAIAGYDPQGISNFLTSLEYTERLRLGFSRMPGFMDTHPTSRERVSSTTQRAASIRWTRKPGIARNRNNYLQRLNGLVVGTAASEGAFTGDRFLHPELGFSLRFPHGWDVLNTRQAVGAVSPRRDAQVVFEFQGQGDDPQKASEEFIAEAEQQGLRIETIQPVLLGEIPAFRATGRASTPRAPVSVHFTWIARGGTIYRLTGISVGRGGNLGGVFNNVARSFRLRVERLDYVSPSTMPQQLLRITRP